MSKQALPKQAGRMVFAGLLFVCLAACAAQPEPTALPTPVLGSPSPVAATATGLPAQPTPATEPFTYTVQAGDTLSSIAARFGLQPETVLWANHDVLHDIPDFLMQGMQLLILPRDGVYHQAGGGDSVASLANFFNANAEDIIAWPGNGIDAQNPQLFIGQWVLVPDGQRALRRRVMPNLPAGAMAVSSEEFGNGACPQNSGLLGQGAGEYAWPVSSRRILAEGYWSGHRAVDLAVELGEPVLAADAGVVVYSGWSNLGYGLMVMLDHGNGDFTLYGGLGAASAVCGSALAQGQPIGLGGMIGHPAGAFVHFEIRRGAEFLNPLDELP
ncbi:MAG: peptidoglycan DD-metalloendopeptidase family protein [Anaerolineales bacterium]|nr:peptidoglycan DD-metalloendopeptidase family protein [Anaerolineales bacterium]